MFRRLLSAIDYGLTLAGADRLLARARRAEVDSLRARIERLEAAAHRLIELDAEPAIDGPLPTCKHRESIAALTEVTKHNVHAIRLAIRSHEARGDVAWQVDLLRHVLAVAGESE